MREKRQKRFKGEKRYIAIILAVVLGLIGVAVDNAKRKEAPVKFPTWQGDVLPEATDNNTLYLNPEPTVVPTEMPAMVEPTAEPTIEPSFINSFNKGDSVITTDEVNIRLNTSTKSCKLGTVPKNTVVDRILSVDGFDLIRYNGKIAFVSEQFTSSNIEDYNNEYYSVEQYDDIVTVSQGLRCRLGPSTNEEALFSMDKNEEAIVIGKVHVFNSNDLWYLVRARGEYGFISAQYTKSLRDQIVSMDPNVDEIKIKKLAYVNKNSSAVYNQNGKKKFTLDKYQLVEILSEYDNNYLVLVDGKVGFINKDNVTKTAGKFLVVDISTQRIYYYYGTDVAMRGRCTTGASKTPTKPGYFITNVKKNHHSFSEDHAAEIVWLAWGTEGVHDAGWEDEENFGDPNFLDSKGCVRVEYIVAWYIRENVIVKTPVLIKK